MNYQWDQWNSKHIFLVSSLSIWIVWQLGYTANYPSHILFDHYPSLFIYTVHTSFADHLKVWRAPWTKTIPVIQWVEEFLHHQQDGRTAVGCLPPINCWISQPSTVSLEHLLWFSEVWMAPVSEAWPLQPGPLPQRGRRRSVFWGVSMGYPNSWMVYKRRSELKMYGL